MKQKNRLRTIYAGTGLAVLALVGGYVLAASTTTSGPAQNTNVTSSSPNGFSTATVASAALIVESSTTVAYTALGSQSASTGGLAGSTTALAACASGPCIVNNRPASQSFTATAGDYAEQVVIAVTQPTSSATGFDMQLTVAGSFSGSPAVAEVYVSTGTTTAGSAQTVDVYMFVDLGTSTAPTVSSVSVVFNSCSSATTCP
jgi:hypothetical protein